MSTLKITELTEANTCGICENAIGRYSCPKCSVIYCSLPCYQSAKHVVCTEAFYKDCVVESLGGDEDEAAVGKGKMMEILQRFHEKNKLEDEIEDADESLHNDNDEDYETVTDSDDDDDNTDLLKDIGTRLAGIDLDDSEEVWKKLNADERLDFESFLMSADISKYIEMWVPWWDYSCEKRCIEVTELDEQKAKCPKIIESISSFCDISAKPPAACVSHNLGNVIAAYTFALRYFNGDHTEFSKATACLIHNISLNLKSNQNFDTFNQAVNSVTAECIQPSLAIMTDSENLAYVKHDTTMILSGPHATERKFYLLAALSDLYTLFGDALKVSPDDDEEKEGNFRKRFADGNFQVLTLTNAEDLKRSTRKIEYYLSYAKDYYDV